MMLNSNTPHVRWAIPLKTDIIHLFLFIFISIAPSQKIWAQDQNQDQAQADTTTTNVVLRFYQEHISGIDGNRCPMYPNCSQYCAQAIQKHGALLGWIMSCDRLLRCGRDEVALSPHVRINGHEFTFDPVSANDSWWFSPKPSAIDNGVQKENLFHSGPGRMSNFNPGHKK